MIRKATFRLGCVAVVTASAQLLGAIPQVQVAAPAYGAENVDLRHTLNLVGGQRMLTQQMSKELLLVAMGYNTDENLMNLQANHERFERVLKGLRFGDAELTLESTKHAGVLESLARVEEIWPLFSAALQNGMSPETISSDAVSLVSDLSLPLLAAMDDTVKSYEDATGAGALFSMLEIAITQADQQRMLTQKMAKEFLLIAYGHDIESNRQRLGKSMLDFEKILKGLISGDAELRLVPTPDPQIQVHLKTVDRLWNELKPILSSAVTGITIDEVALAEMVSLNVTMLSEMNSAVDLYESL